MRKQLVTRKQLSQRSGIAERTIRTLQSQRIIPYIRAGHRTVLFDEDKVMAALDKLEVKAVS